MATRYILPTLAFASAALAQCSGPLTIASTADAAAIQGCATYQGDITIDSSASGNIAIDGVATISGDLICNNATMLTSISGSRLQEISGTFNLQSLTILSSLSFPYLARVNKINWITIPAIQQLGFTTGVSEANSVYISDTGLTSLSGIELTRVGSMDINNNQFLKTINVNSLTNVTNFLSFSANGMDLEIEFPNLEGAANLTFRNISSISMPSLSEVDGSMGFYSNYFDTFAAPNLTKTGDTIAFVDNPNLSNLTFPQLQLVGGGIQLANNTKLEEVTGFNALQQIGGDISFAGVFSVVSFGSLTNVRGAANVITSSTNNTICDLFNQAKQKTIIKGKTTCATGQSTPETNGSVSGGGSNKKNFAVSQIIPTAMLTGSLSLVAALLFI